MYRRFAGVIGMCFGGVLLALVTTGAAQAASFDCKKASSKVEHAICDDRSLDGLDQSMASLYADARANSTDEAAAALRRDQVEWLKARNACVSQPTGLNDCLKGQMQTRITQLDKAKEQGEASLDQVLVRIPSDPVAAANGLRRYHVGLSAAWMLYLHKFVPAAGVSAAEAQTNLKIAKAALANEPTVLAVMDDTEKNKGANSGDYVLTMLRLQIERADYEPPRAPVHCFIFARQDEAYDAFGPFYGSSQDSAAPVCDPQGDLFEQPAWKTLTQALDPVLDKATPKLGTMRFSSYVQWRILELRATVSPRDFLKPPKGPAGDSPEQQIRGWTNNDSWPQAQRDQALAAIPATEKATAQWLQSQRGLSSGEAAKASHAVVQEWLDERMSYIQQADGI